MGSRLLSSKKLGARISLATLTAQIALSSLTLGLAPTMAIAADNLLSDGFGTGSNSNDISGWEEEGNDTDSHSLAQNFSTPASSEDGISPDGGRFAKMKDGEWICSPVNAVGYNTLSLS
jgi:hypothetical protein